MAKPVLVMRNVSVAAGTACLTGTAPEAIVGTLSSLRDDPRADDQPANPYGDGHATL